MKVTKLACMLSLLALIGQPCVVNAAEDFSIPYSFRDGEVVSAKHFNANFQAIVEELRKIRSELSKSARVSTSGASGKELERVRAIAEDAKVSADEANSKIDNMFKKSMYR